MRTRTFQPQDGFIFPTSGFAFDHHQADFGPYSVARGASVVGPFEDVEDGRFAAFGYGPHLVELGDGFQCVGPGRVDEGVVFYL